MPLVQNVFMKDDVWRRVGKKTRRYRFNSLVPSNFTSAEYGLLLTWDKTLTFLSVAPQHKDKLFSRGQQAFENVAREVATQPPDPSFLEGKHVLVARIQRTDPISIEFVVDTDDPCFSRYAEDPVAKQNKEIRITIGLMAFAGRNAEEGQINLVLAPATDVALYEGYVALDIGNTSSTLVCLPAGVGHDAQTKAILVLDANEERPGTLKPNVDPVISHVRIDAAENFSDSPSSARWIVGRLASAVTDGLIVGPKRLVAGKGWEETQVFNARFKVILPRRVPAELLVCKILQRFREATSREPEVLALTYPTTYEPRELKQLREVVYRGFQRSRWREQANAKDEEKVKSRVPVMLDEASAAAYFFLYQKILETAGGLPRFRYLYPQGLNLLLYDCGGGTTDIALVTANSEPGSRKLVISVKARSGLRDFGGDNITVAVFRILKAKLAIEISRLLGSKETAWPDKPVGAADLEKRLQEDCLKFDKLIPTTFDHDVMDDENRRRRNYALELWRLADAVKCKLGDGSSAALESAVGSAAMLPGTLGEYVKGKFGDDVVKLNQAMKTLLQVKVHRWEVDCLVQNDIEKSIKNCNELIRTKITAHGQEVHWVVASGNGARYPLIQEHLKKTLDVPFIDDGRFTLDIVNLKHAVAKGAVLYLMALRSPKMFEVEFDTDLSDCLPFDVVYHDPATHTYPLLFQEHTGYEKIAADPPKRLEAVASPGTSPSSGVSTRRIELFRRWPGDGEVYSPYVRFEFEEEVQFPVEVSFNNKETKQFEAKDSTGALGTVCEESDKRIYESPVQRGDL